MSREEGKTCTYISEGERKSPFNLPQPRGTSTSQSNNNREQLMASGDISLVLLFEPRTNREGPVMIARVDDPSLIARAARVAVGAAQKRAAEMCDVDELIGQVEVAEADRLKALFTLLMPGWGSRDELQVPVSRS